jgi:hypothetical protein
MNVKHPPVAEIIAVQTLSGDEGKNLRSGAQKFVGFTFA